MIGAMTAGPIRILAPSSSTALDRAVGDAVAGYLADDSVPGIAFAAVDRDGPILSGVGGWRDLAARRPVDADTLFEVGSIGKTFAARIVLRLVDEGRLGLHDPVVVHLPWFRVPRTGDRITIHHLLSHTAGITAGIDGTPEGRIQVWRLRFLPPGSAPGRRQHYSNVGYKALGLVIEAAEGRPYPDVLRDRILAPLGMRASEPAITNDLRPRLAIGYGPRRDDVPFRAGDPLAPATWLETSTADGSIAATAPDLAAFARDLLGDPTGSVERMATADGTLGALGYGYALLTREIGGRIFRGHGGGMVGYLAGMQWDVATGVGAVVLQNGPGHNPNALARLLVRRILATREGRDPDGEGPEDGAWEPAPDAGNGETLEASNRSVEVVPLPAQVILAGTYRSHNPWTPVFRVEARTDGLWLVFPSPPDGFDDEQPLVPMARGWFRVGADRLGPERLRFDTMIDGLAHRAWLSGWDYYRVS